METASSSPFESLPIGFIVLGVVVLGLVWFMRRLPQVALRNGPLDGNGGSGGPSPLDGLSAAEIQAQVAQLAADGRKIEAIKLYRDATGSGLKEAKDAVESGDLSAISGHASPTRGAQGAGGDSGSVNHAELRALIESGQKIEAIKRYREMSGVGLKEAKDAVEHWAASPGSMPDGATGPSGDTAGLDDEVKQLMSEGRAIDAVKLIRERLGLGLREAKDYADRIR